MKTLADIFRKANPPALPPRVPVREVGQKKLREVNQEGTQMKSAPQLNQITNAEPFRVHIVEAYPDELQPVKQAENRIFQPIRSQHLTVTPKSERFAKNDIWKNKSVYKRTNAPCDPIGKTTGKE